MPKTAKVPKVVIQDWIY